MLKIKDNVDLKELEKFGFEKNEYSYVKKIYCRLCTIIIEVHPDKLIFLQNDYYDNDFSYLIPNIIYDLIQAGLVERVEDKWITEQ